MKKVLGLAALLGLVGSASAFAVSQNQTWDQILADNSVSKIYQGPYADAFGPAGFFNACVAGDTLKTISPIEVCSAWANSPGSGSDSGPVRSHVSPTQECVSYGTITNSISVHQTYEQCVAWEQISGKRGHGATCVKTAPVGYDIPTTASFQVFEKGTPRGHGENSGETFAFNKEFTIPTCK